MTDSALPVVFLPPVHPTRWEFIRMVEWYGWLGWGVALFFAIVAHIGWRREPTGSAGSRPSGAPASPVSAARAPAPRSLDPNDMTSLRATVAYLRRAILPDLHEAKERFGAGGSPAADPLLRALDALDDLAFYADAPPDEEFTDENLAQVVQEAVREYTIETRIPVRVHASPEPIEVRVRREALKDAVFLLLANAGQYGDGRPIDVYLEGEDGGFRIRVLDDGPGFSAEALDRGLEPFWSSDPLGLGMGLPQARARVAEMKGRLSLRNQDGGGAEATLSFPVRFPAMDAADA